MGKPIIPTAKVWAITEDPHIEIEVAAMEYGRPVSRETQARNLEVMVKEIRRHIDDVASIRVVVRKVYVCKWCENPADDCDPDGTPICCGEAVEEYEAKYKHLEKKEA